MAALGRAAGAEREDAGVHVPARAGEASKVGGTRGGRSRDVCSLRVFTDASEMTGFQNLKRTDSQVRAGRNQ